MPRLACVVLTLLAAGCAGLESHVRTRAAHDFQCREADLRILDQAETVFRVAGCGHEATYVCSDNASLRTSCKRVAATEREPTASTAAN